LSLFIFFQTFVFIHLSFKRLSLFIFFQTFVFIHLLTTTEVTFQMLVVADVRYLLYKYVESETPLNPFVVLCYAMLFQYVPCNVDDLSAGLVWQSDVIRCYVKLE